MNKRNITLKTPPLIVMFSATFKSPRNQQLLHRLIKDVVGVNPSFDAADVRG